MKTDKKSSNVKNCILFFCFLVLSALASCGVVFLLQRFGQYPYGSDVYFYLYRGKSLFSHVLNGNYFPLYDAVWYNGSVTVGQVPPVTVYFTALLYWLSGENILTTYLLFVGSAFFLGAFSWNLTGLFKGRPVMAGILGLLWMILPFHAYVLLGEGDFSGVLFLAFLPLLLHGIYEYLIFGRRGYVIFNILMGTFLLLTGGIYFLHFFLGLLLLLLFYRVSGGLRNRSLNTLFSMVLSMGLGALWFVPYVVSGALSSQGSEEMELYFQSILTSLNPVKAYAGDGAYSYLGLSVFLLMLFGFIAAKKAQRLGFFTAILLFLTTAAFWYPLLSKLPGSSLIWMLQFMGIIGSLCVFCFFSWRTLKRPFMALVLLLLALDGGLYASSFLTAEPESPEEYLAEVSEESLFEEARDLTVQRLCYIDGSADGSLGAYLLTEGDSENSDTVSQVFGVGWKQAATSENVSLLNEAANDGCYIYLFDRCLSMGADTVLLRVEMLKEGSDDISTVTHYAAQVGYTLCNETEERLLFHYNVESIVSEGDSFGVTSALRGIAIGSDAGRICLSAPDLEEGTSLYLDEYSYEQLSAYEIIYLAGFTYHDMDAAEELVRSLSEDGVYVVFYADGIPADGTTKTKEFLGVTALPISFENGYPILYVEGETYDLSLFPEGYEDWNTYYLQGLSDVSGMFYDNTTAIDFLGTGENDHLIYIGLNLNYFYALTQDSLCGQILENAVGNHLNTVPKRTVVPLTISVLEDTITIESDVDFVDTTLAYESIFNSEGEIVNRNHLLEVDSGVTVITMDYPYFVPALAISVICIIILLLVIVFLLRKKRHQPGEPEVLFEEEGVITLEEAVKASENRQDTAETPEEEWDELPTLDNVLKRKESK